MLNHPTGLFSWDYNSALRGCWSLKFLHTSQLPKMYFKSYLRRRAASCWALPYISSLFLKDRIETVKEFYDKLNRFDTVQDCDGRTDRQTCCGSIQRAAVGYVIAYLPISYPSCWVCALRRSISVFETQQCTHQTRVWSCTSKINNPD